MGCCTTNELRQEDEQETRGTEHEQQSEQHVQMKPPKRATVMDDEGEKSHKKPKGRRQREAKYKFFFSVNIRTNDNDETIIGNTKELRPLLADLFETRSEKDVLEIKTRKKRNGFKIDFEIIIATSMSPAAYIDSFEHYDGGSLQETIKDGFDFEKDPKGFTWEARYEKFDPTKRKE